MNNNKKNRDEIWKIKNKREIKLKTFIILW
jgi:hypothetical protein